MDELHVVRDRLIARQLDYRDRIPRTSQRRDLGAVRICQAFDVHEYEATVLARRARREIVRRPDPLVNDDFDADVLALAQALLKVLLGPNRSALPLTG